MNWKLVLVGVLCCIFATCFAEPIPIDSCGSELGTIISIDVSPCPQIPCIIKLGTNVTATVTFISKKSVTSATVAIDMMVGEIVIGQYPLDDTNGCNGMECPIKDGDERTYTTTINMKYIVPLIPITAAAKMFFGPDLAMCFKVPIIFVL